MRTQGIIVLCTSLLLLVLASSHESGASSGCPGHTPTFTVTNNSEYEIDLFITDCAGWEYFPTVPEQSSLVVNSVDFYEILYAKVTFIGSTAVTDPWCNCGSTCTPSSPLVSITVNADEVIVD